MGRKVRIGSIVSCLSMRAVIVCIVLALSPAAALNIDGNIVRRRSVAAGLAALAPVVLTARATAAAQNQVCFGKCPEDPSKAAERRAIQQGSGSKPPPTFAELVEQSIKQKESTLGMSLSD